MSISRSHADNQERLGELTDSQDYMNEFFDYLMVNLQKPANMHFLKSQAYANLMRKLTFIQELRSKISKRGNELSLKPILAPGDLEELHFIRILDSGHIDCVWIAIREFLGQTGLKIDVDTRRT